MKTGDDKTLTALDGDRQKNGTADYRGTERQTRQIRNRRRTNGGSCSQAFKPYQAETLEILIAWGEKRNEAMELIELACKKHPDIKTAEELVPLVYRLKQGIEV